MCFDFFTRVGNKKVVCFDHKLLTKSICEIGSLMTKDCVCEQCCQLRVWKSENILSLWFYVKSILETSESQKTSCELTVEFDFSQFQIPKELN